MLNIVQINSAATDSAASAQLTERALVGGKGRHLMLCSAAGFPVPPGFTITTDAYDAFLAHNKLTDTVAKSAAAFVYHDVDTLEQQATAIQEVILNGQIPPALAEEVAARYSELGGYVAVRSSGTAEDMADASFAGLHDTFLDITGEDALLEAVKKCWASLWTSRAIAYRGEQGHAPGALPKLAVVVQQMVEADAAGVMFTANPLTSNTDEIVVNSCWGLGEGLVSGIVNPDQFVLGKDRLAIKERMLGDKAVTVKRNPDGPDSTVSVPTPEPKREAWSIADDTVVRLGELARRIERYFDGLPQDIEWAVKDNEIFVLQSRAITGVDFTWDSDVDAWQEAEDEPEAIWTRKFADEFWTGPITPLFYSVRARGFTNAGVRSALDWGFADVAAKRRHKYFKAEVYTNSEYQKALVSHAIPKSMREGSVAWLNSADRKAAASWPFSWREYVRMLARIQFMTQNGLYEWFKEADNYDLEKVPERGRLDPEALKLWSDEALRRLIKQYTDYAENKHYSQWTGWFIHAANAMTILGKMLASWYDGTNANIFTDLITGLPERTRTMQENIDLWQLASAIRSNAAVRELFEKSSETEFFDRLADLPEGASVYAQYREFLDLHGHRGHADRDFYFPRRLDDPAIDYRLLKALLSGDGSFDPVAAEKELQRRREAAVADVLDRLRNQPMGALRVAAFNTVYKYVVRFMLHRDNQRHHLDRVTYAKKLAFTEVGRRVHERGLLPREDDFYFLTEDELFGLLHGTGNARLCQAKVIGRRNAFEQYASGKFVPPEFMQNGREWVDPEAQQLQVADDGSGIQGFGTSPGTYTGRARVITSLDDIGRVEQGDVLITNSTDPAWTPVFLVIGGLVLETGGLLAHGACLSREYNLPAVTAPAATTRIPDGATITVDGVAGTVIVHQEATVQ